MEENKKGLLNTLEENRKREEERLAGMSEEQRKDYMDSKAKSGLEIAKKLGLKVGR